MNLDGTFNEGAQGAAITVRCHALQLMAVHGFLALALKHPEASKRPSAPLVAQFARDALQGAIDAGLFTERGLMMIAHDEATEDWVLPDCLLELRRKGGAA
jgi:hypothetical protein